MIWYKLLSFCKRVQKREPENSEEVQSLLVEIDKVKKSIDAARSNFNNVTDPDSIDYYTYILKAYQVRHDMLIRQLKAIMA